MRGGGTEECFHKFLDLKGQKKKKEILQSNRMNYSERSRGKGTNRDSCTQPHTHTHIRIYVYVSTQREIWKDDEKGVVSVHRAAAAVAASSLSLTVRFLLHIFTASLHFNADTVERI